MGQVKVNLALFPPLCYLNDMETYSLIRSRRRTLALEITKDCRLLVRAPLRCPEGTIREFVTRNQLWIDRHMSVQLYAGSLSLVCRSGVGQAVLHQKEMLSDADIVSTERFVPEARTVHINTVLPDAPLAAFRAHLAGKKVVYYGHSTEEDFRNSFKGSNLLAPLFRRWIKFCYERGDVIITPTPYSKQLLESYGICRPIYALSNGVDTDFFTPSLARRKVFREKYGVREQEKAVLSVGHYIARKGLVDFVDMSPSNRG